MNAYQPRTDDMQFVLSRVLNAPARLQALPAFAEVDADLMQQLRESETERAAGLMESAEDLDRVMKARRARGD